MPDAIKDIWDYRVPETVEDVVCLLRRRVEVHAWWRDFSLAGSERAQESEEHGTGSAESHQRYIDQYEGAIAALAAAKPEESE